MKVRVADIIHILHTYKEFTDLSARDITQVVVTRPHDKNFLVRFKAQKQPYALLIDNNAEDDYDYIMEQVHESGVIHDYELLNNPHEGEEDGYGIPHRGKDWYLFIDHSAGRRLDLVLVDMAKDDLSRSSYQKLIKQGLVKVNGEVVTSPKFPVLKTDEVTVEETDQISTHTKPEGVEVIYEDDNILVINKPAGLLTHAKGELIEEPVAADLIRDETSYKADTNRPGIIHRLDRDTSGILVMVKNETSASYISKQFTDRTVKKVYHAVVTGQPKQDSALIDLPINRNPSKPGSFRVDANGKSATTVYSVLDTNGTRSLVELKPRTGRTHQLRVHMEYIGTPILGDRVYGKESASRMYLHAHSLEFTLPGGERKTFTAPTPEEFTLEAN